MSSPNRQRSPSVNQTLPERFGSDLPEFNTPALEDQKAEIKADLERRFEGHPLFDPSLASAILGYVAYDPQVHTWEYAIDSNNLKLLQYLVTSVNPEIARMPQVMTYAAERGNLPAVRFLESVGGDVHDDDESPLIWAAAAGHLEVVQYILSRGSSQVAIETALSKAAGEGHLEVVRHIISLGASLFAIQEALLAAVWFFRRTDTRDVIQYLLDTFPNLDLRDAMRTAMERGYLPIVQMLLERNAEIEDFMIRLAADNGHFHIIDFLMLIEHNLDFVMHDILVAAIRQQRYDIVRHLLCN